MARYATYLEISDDGLTMAHVLSLAGCTVRAPSREEALQRLPGAIRDYLAWLRRHGEAAPTETEPIEIAVVEESTGLGPFTPGDTAALFAPDRDPITPEEMEHHFRLMADSRADLLALVEDLPDELLDWRPDPQSYTIRRVLRHIGNAEEWYVSRLVSPETLPAEWEDDEGLPILEFLEMERRTALDRLRRLSETERSEVFYPQQWTDHPEERWTARKALRRFLEHEREHVGQAREILSMHRRHLLAGLAAARGELVAQLVSLDERTLAEVPACGDWTVKDTLAHIAAWDRWSLRELGRMVDGEDPDTSAVRDINGFNAANVAAWKKKALGEVVAEMHEARAAWVAWMESLPEEEFFRRRRRARSDWGLPKWVEVFRGHDEEHASHLAEWRETQEKRPGGPKHVLLAALAARRAELLAASALVPADRRTSLPVCGHWTLRDVVGHIADWESWTVEGLGHMAAGRAPQVPYVEDEEAWNQEHARARRDQPLEAAWADFQAARQALLEILEGMDQVALEQAFPGVWDAETTPYAWALVSLAHDAEHARDITEVLLGAAGPAENGPAKSYTSRGK